MIAIPGIGLTGFYLSHKLVMIVQFGQEWQKMNTHIWLARSCILLVLTWNLQAAVSLTINNNLTATALGLPGPAGRAAVLGLAVLFIMWNIPYAVAAFHPVTHRISLIEALAMQAVALLGETLILTRVPDLPVPLVSTIRTFISFDAAGLFLLLAAVWLTRSRQPTVTAVHPSQ
jgi:hypothetical protein